MIVEHAATRGARLVRDLQIGVSGHGRDQAEVRALLDLIRAWHQSSQGVPQEKGEPRAAPDSEVVSPECVSYQAPESNNPVTALPSTPRPIIGATVTALSSRTAARTCHTNGNNTDTGTMAKCAIASP